LQIGTTPHVLVLGLNAQNEIWSSSKINGAGVSLNNLVNSPFFVLNNGSDTKISAAISYTNVPDISITNCKNFKLEWNVRDDPMGSDHLIHSL